MATKTVITTNQMPQAKQQLGISIIIDQDQAPNLQLIQRQQQKQLTLTELGETATNDVEVSTKQKMSPNSPKALKKTFIDINRNNVDEANNDSQTINGYHHNNHINSSDHHQQNHHHQVIVETGYTTKTSPTFPPTMGERGKLEKTEIERYTTTTNVEATDDDSVQHLNGKSPTQATTTHNELKMRSTNGTINNIDEETIKKTIIQCNIEKNKANVDDDDHHNEESIRICGGSNNKPNDTKNDDDGDTHDRGQLLYNGLRLVGTTHSQKISLEPSDDVADGLAVSRLMKAEDCASAINIDTNATATDQKLSSSHVVKIQIKPKLNQNLIKTDKQVVTVVQVNDIEENLQKISINKTELNLNLCKMVQKSPISQANNNNSITSGNTTVTELNVTNPNYLYYTMSSGQFSPCDTLDSGTGSDLESNGTSVTTPMQTTKNINDGIGSVTTNASGGSTPKLELHLKTTKIRINNNNTQNSENSKNNAEHQRAGSLTDSEESEASSLSCDSLHSTEYVRQLSASPSGKKSSNKSPISAFLPDSLLRDIRDRKFPTNDFETKYGNQAIIETVDENENLKNDKNAQKMAEEVAEHAKFLQECNVRESEEAVILNGKRSSLPPGKTFIINTDNGTFVDTKMNSMPRKYEADKYYNFHVNEHENFHSFGHNSHHNNGNGNGHLNDDEASLSEYDLKSIHDDDFAGYKDIRCNSATSTIRSSKGTVRGVKNRVRNGIATFLQMQQPHVKNYLDKDLGKVVLYTTSMGIIRETYAKCSNVKQILRTLLVKFDERDIFMSVEYQAEIKNRMHTDIIRVPQLFVEGQHIGDAETVERLNESGELRQLLKPYKSISTTYTCQTCGGYRLLPCPSCNGSKKSVHRNHFTAEFVALKCMNCDEVGLVKCHNC